MEFWIFFSDNTLFKIDKIDKFKNRSKFNLEVDGGIDSTNFYKLKLDKLVFGIFSLHQIIQ